MAGCSTGSSMLPCGRILDEHFEDPRVQAALLGNVDIRSLDEPGELMGWASVKPNLLVDPMNQGLLPGGMGTLARALERAAQAAGALIRTGAEVRRILVDDAGAACGVELADGQVIRAPTVISNADPKRTFLGLIEPGAVPPDLASHIGALETRSGSVKFHAAVRELPDLGRFVEGPPDPRKLAMVRIAPSIGYVTDSLADAAAGLPTRSPIITLQIPTVYDPTIAPPGRHIVSMWVKFQPTRLASGTWDDVRDAVREQLIDVVTGYAPNFRASIIDCALYTPLDMEQRVGLTDGSIHHLDHSVTQLLGDRLFPGGGYRTPIAGLYMCGAGTHPGGEVSGAPGHNAARLVLADLAEGGPLWRTISSAVLTHPKGLEPSFHCLVKASIMATSSLTLRKLPRRMALRVRMPNDVSTWFIQEAEVGVKWKMTRGFAASQVRTSGVVWVDTLSSTTWSSPPGYARATRFMKARKPAPVWRSRVSVVTCPVPTSSAANRQVVPWRV